MTVWMGGPAVVGVEDEGQRWEDTALSGACIGDLDIGEGVIDQQPQSPVGQEVCNSKDQLVRQVEAGGVFLCEDVWP